MSFYTKKGFEDALKDYSKNFYEFIMTPLIPKKKNKIDRNQLQIYGIEPMIMNCIGMSENLRLTNFIEEGVTQIRENEREEYKMLSNQVTDNIMSHEEDVQDNIKAKERIEQEIEEIKKNCNMPEEMKEVDNEDTSKVKDEGIFKLMEKTHGEKPKLNSYGLEPGYRYIEVDGKIVIKKCRPKSVHIRSKDAPEEFEINKAEIRKTNSLYLIKLDLPGCSNKGDEIDKITNH